jgi:hypothetical protein
VTKIAGKGRRHFEPSLIIIDDDDDESSEPVIGRSRIGMAEATERLRLSGA